MKNKSNENLRSGITTGASAAAAAGAATKMLVQGEGNDFHKIINPQGKELVVKIKQAYLEGQSHKGIAIVTKDGGDDPDTTSGLDIIAEVILEKRTEFGELVQITGGVGVGKVTKPGLQIPIAESAINPVPREMITWAVKQELPEGYGAKVIISVPGGEAAAKRTLNPKLGIEGGISILGTTGIVEPMSEDSFKRSLVPQIQMAKAYGFSVVCLVPGRLGEKWAVDKLGLPSECVVQMSNFVGYMLEACVREEIKGVILLGHHSKLTKVAAGCFHTHNRVSDARMETITAYAALHGAAKEVLEKLMYANTSEECFQILKDNSLLQVYSSISESVSKRASDHVFGDLETGTIMFTMQGEIVTFDNGARELGRRLGWKM